MLLSYTDSPSPSRSTSYHGGLREFGFLLQPPLLSSFEERLGCFLKVLLSLLPHLFPPCAAPFSQAIWADTACTGVLFRAAYSLGVTDCVSGFPSL